MLKGMGIGWTYVLLGAILLTAIPVVYLSIRIGPKYRIKRQQERAEALARLTEATNKADEKA
jgi:hypothetical protein